MAILFGTGEKYRTTNKSSESTITVPIWLTRKKSEDVTVDVMVTGLKEAGEDWGWGKEYTGTGTWENAGYATNKTSVTFSAGETEKTVSVTIVNSPLPDMDRYLKFTLSNPTNDVVSKAAGTITVRVNDDTRDVQLNVCKLPESCPIGGCSGWEGSAWNLDKTGTQNNNENFQNLMNHFKDYHSAMQPRIVAYIPAGKYLLGKYNACGLYFYVNKYQLSIVGPANPIDNSSASQARFIQMANEPSSRLIGVGPWNPYSGTDTWRFGIRNVILDGNYKDSYYIENRTGWHQYEQTQCLVFTNTDQYIQFGVEAVRFDNTISDSILNYTYADTRIYHTRHYYNFRGAISVTGNHLKLVAKDVIGYWEDTGYEMDEAHVSGFDMEPTSESANHIYTVVIEGDYSTTTLRRLTITRPDGHPGWGDGLAWRNNHFATILLENCNIYGRPMLELDRTGTATLNNCNFYGYEFSDTDGSLMGVPVVNILGSDVGDATFEFNNCNFSWIGSRTVTVPCYGVCARRDSNDTDLVTFTNCYFDSTLDAVAMGAQDSGTYSSKRMQFNDCTFNNSGNNNAASFRAYACNWGTEATYRFELNGGTYNGPKLFAFTHAGTLPCELSNILFSDFSVAKDKNIATATGSMLTVYFSKPDDQHPSVMTRANPCVVTAAGHGLNNGDKIQFTNVRQTGWKEALWPNSNMPIFTVANRTDDTFELQGLATSGLADDYDAVNDPGVFFAYPLREIVGETGDNPNTLGQFGLAGDRFIAGTTYWRCKTTGVPGTWELE